jgi:NAD dependent epimerase/dehydratase family enzyme
MVGILRHALFSPTLAGPINATAPEPVTNAEFTRELARVLHRPAFLRAPEFALRLAMGEMADMLLGSQRVIPKIAQQSGYKFQFQTLRRALEALLGDETEVESEKKTRAAAGNKETD